MSIISKTALSTLTFIFYATSAQASPPGSFITLAITKGIAATARPVAADFVGNCHKTTPLRAAYNDLTANKSFFETFASLKKKATPINQTCDKIIKAQLSLTLRTKDAGAVWRWFTDSSGFDRLDAGDTVSQASIGGFIYDFSGAHATGPLVDNIPWLNTPLPLANSAGIPIPVSGSIDSPILSYTIPQSGLDAMNNTNRFSFCVVEDSAVVKAELSYTCSTPI
ncbi:hypothetical protein [Crenothrix polyspora]|uniref:Uncharacterized protein n=1 Tax=Crenothrix polyspora TaxID=360316 RepID=A0A1R4H960_9GAMM|nr:hypothetical protein [Crenothrix polyspora]SJM92707.1 exported hypothetical protein [Crenothrix polyspora]